MKFALGDANTVQLHGHHRTHNHKKRYPYWGNWTLFDYIPALNASVVVRFFLHNRVSEDERFRLSMSLSSLQLDLAREVYEAAAIKDKRASKTEESAKETVLEWVNDELKKANDLTSQLSEKISGWEQYLDAKEDVVNNLKPKFNFMGLIFGFQQMETTKRRNRIWVFIGVVLLGLMAIGFPMAALSYHLDFDPKLLQWKIDYDNLLKISPLMLPIEILLIYYFRILLKNLQSISAQLLQLDLRKSICMFIESYSERLSSLPEGVSLEKFEELIFSNIVMDGVQIPSTFDGVDKLVEAFKGRN